MTDDQIRMAVAKCAGWEWYEDDGSYADDSPLEDFGMIRLEDDVPLRLDDVAAACEAANTQVHLYRAIDSDLWQAQAWIKLGEGALEGSVTHAWSDPAKALALALCEACGVEVEDD